MAKLWLTQNDLYYKLIESQASSLSILAEEEIIPGKLNYSILDISISSTGIGFDIVKSWNYSIRASNLYKFSRKIHRGIILDQLMPVIKNHWNKCTKEHLPIDKTDILISISYDKNMSELFNVQKWHLGTFHKSLFFQPYIKGNFDKVLTKKIYKDYYNGNQYITSIKMDKIPFYKALKWISLNNILNIVEKKDGCSKNETAIHNME